MINTNFSLNRKMFSMQSLCVDHAPMVGMLCDGQNVKPENKRSMAGFALRLKIMSCLLRSSEATNIPALAVQVACCLSYMLADLDFDISDVRFIVYVTLPYITKQLQICTYVFI